MQADIPYAKDADPMHRLNLYAPTEAAAGASLPSIIDIHGGGWMYGDAALNANFCRYLASRGYAVMGMGYRLLPRTDLIGQVRDVFASMRWLAHNGARESFDLSRVLLTGDSAGGHLAGLCACVQASSDLQRLYGVEPLPFGFSAVCVNHGVCDVNHLGFLPGWGGEVVQRAMLRMLLGVDEPPRSALWGHVSLPETAAGLALPPLLMIASEADSLCANTLRTEAALRQMGTPPELLLWTRQQGEQLGHVFNLTQWEWPESKRTNEAMLAFFERCTAQPVDCPR